MACTFPDCLFISRNCNCVDSCRRGNHETVFPNSLWSNMHLKSFNHSGVVPCFHFSIYRSFSASEPQFNCRTFTNRSCYSHYLLHHGLGSFREPTKTTLYLLRTFIAGFAFVFIISRLECTWNYSIFFQRTQFGPRNSGKNELDIYLYSFYFKFIISI